LGQHCQILETPGISGSKTHPLSYKKTDNGSIASEGHHIVVDVGHGGHLKTVSGPFHSGSSNALIQIVSSTLRYDD